MSDPAERFFLACQPRLSAWLAGIGAAMAYTGAAHAGAFLAVLSLVLLVPFFVVHGIFADPPAPASPAPARPPDPPAPAEKG